MKTFVYYITICNIIRINHFSHSVSSYGNTAADMADDQIQVFIFLSCFCAIADTDLLLV